MILDCQCRKVSGGERQQQSVCDQTPLPGGWVVVSDILSLPRGRGFTEEDVRRVVAENDKQRFALQEEGDNLLIRANQGHSMEVGVV